MLTSPQPKVGMDGIQIGGSRNEEGILNYFLMINNMQVKRVHKRFLLCEKRAETGETRGRYPNNILFFLPALSSALQNQSM